MAGKRKVPKGLTPFTKGSKRAKAAGRKAPNRTKGKGKS